MAKELSQDWLNWIFENIQNGCDKKELLDILLQEGFDASYCKVALGFDLTGDDFVEARIEFHTRVHIENRSSDVSNEILGH